MASAATLIRRESRPFVLKTGNERFRGDGNSAEAKRWLEVRAEYLVSLLGGRFPTLTINSLTVEARTMIEQVCDLVVQSDLVRAALLRGEDVDTDHLVRLAITTERHLSAIKKLGTIVKPGTKATRDDGKEFKWGPTFE